MCDNEEYKAQTAEQLTRDILEKGIHLLRETDHNDPQRLTSGDVVEMANMIRSYWRGETVSREELVDSLDVVARACNSVFSCVLRDNMEADEIIGEEEAKKEEDLENIEKSGYVLEVQDEG